MCWDNNEIMIWRVKESPPNIMVTRKPNCKSIDKGLVVHEKDTLLSVHPIYGKLHYWSIVFS
jgi:hypothetical protein